MRAAKAILITPQAENPAAFAAAFDAADRVLADGDLLCLLPEGGITCSGALQLFKGGVMKILQRRPVSVVPVVQLLHARVQALLAQALPD